MDGTHPPHAAHRTAPVKRHVTSLRIGDWIDLDGRPRQIRDIRARADGSRVIHFPDAPPLTRGSYEPVHVYAAPRPRGPHPDSRNPDSRNPDGEHYDNAPGPSLDQQENDRRRPAAPRDAPLDRRTEQGIFRAARRRGITDLQVVALVHRRGRLLLVQPPGDDSWTVPFAWVHPGESVTDALDWLCSPHLGLADWRAALHTMVIRPEADSPPTLQLVFDVTSHTDTNPPPFTHRRWWNTSQPPPQLHRLARPLLARLAAD